MSNGRLNQVLLVGEEGARLEVDLVPYGLSCVTVGNANDAVARLKVTAFPLVVVTAALPDMSGPAFVEGLLRHFDPATVVLFGDIEPGAAAQLQRSPKVALFPTHSDGAAIADFLFKRVGGSSVPPQAAPTGPQQVMGFPGPGSARGMFGDPRGLPRSNTSPALSSSLAPSMAPSIAPSFAHNPWPAGGAAQTQSPFFAELGQSQAAQQALSSTSAPPSAAADRAVMDQLAAELAQANSELQVLRGRIGPTEAAARDATERASRAEHEAAQLRTEVDAARRSAINQVADVMALSDEGEPIEAEMDDLKSRADMAESERDSATSQLNMVRAERDRLTSDLSLAHQQLQERALELDGLRRQLQDGFAELERTRAAGDSTLQLLHELESRSAENTAAVAGLQTALADKDAEHQRALEAQAAAVRAEMHASHAADIEAQVEMRLRPAIAETQAQQARVAVLQTELEALRLEKADVEAAWAADQQRAGEADAKIGAAEAARVDIETSLRADLNAALKQLDEESQAARLEAARADRFVKDAAALRQMLEGMTHEQARLVGEIEQLRPLAAAVDKGRATVVDMQRQLEAALGTDEADGDASKAIAEAVKAQTRELRELGRAIEPFSWGLERATAFFQGQNVEGATEHIRALQLLAATLERMKTELNKVHSSPPTPAD